MEENRDKKHKFYRLENTLRLCLMPFAELYTNVTNTRGLNSSLSWPMLKHLANMAKARKVKEVLLYEPEFECSQLIILSHSLKLQVVKC